MCGSNEVKPAAVRSPKDDWARQLGMPGARSHWVVCTECGLVFQSPRPRLESIAALYSGGKYHETRGGVPDHYIKYSLRRAEASLDWALSQIEFAPSSHALDIGCGVGGALVTLRQRGWQVVGVEPDPVLAETGRERFGLEIVEGVMDDHTFQPTVNFDLAYSCHVWEHLADPVATSRAAWKVLCARRGYLLIVVPTFRRARTLAWGYFGSPHTYMFTDDSLNNVLQQAGFETVAYRYEGAADTELWLLARVTNTDGGDRTHVVPRREKFRDLQRELALVPLRAPLGFPSRLRTHTVTLAKDPGDFAGRLGRWARSRWHRLVGGLR